MLLALPPNQKGYRMALFFCLCSLLSALRAALSAASGELMILMIRAPIVAGCYLVCRCEHGRSMQGFVPEKPCGGDNVMMGESLGVVVMDDVIGTEIGAKELLCQCARRLPHCRHAAICSHPPVGAQVPTAKDQPSRRFASGRSRRGNWTFAVFLLQHPTERHRTTDTLPPNELRSHWPSSVTRRPVDMTVPCCCPSQSPGHSLR
jgi:hypothetical protein